MAMAYALGAAIRNLRRAPAFTGLVVLTLALGIGTTTAMFSVVDSILLNPLPFPNADRLSSIYTATGNRPPGPGAAKAALPALRRDTATFAAVEAFQFGTSTLAGGGDPENVSAPLVTPGLFAMVGLAPELGRFFTDEEAQLGSVVLLSHTLWASRFGSDPAIIGKAITVDDQPQRVVGVMPAGFRFPEGNARLWRPLDVRPTAKPSLRLQVIALRRAGMTQTEANDRLKALAPELQASGAIGKADVLSTGLLLQQRWGNQTGQALYILFGAVFLVLLVACVNVMNLLLARASVKSSELALMAALGASAGGLMRTVLIESAVLAAVGCAAGLLLAKELLKIILRAAPSNLTFLSGSDTLDGRAVWFAVVLAFATCIVFGLVPAWRAARVDAMEALKRAARNVAAGDDWWQGALVASQLALVLVLLAGSGLLLRSFDRLLRVDPGFDVDHLAVVDLQLQQPRYAAPGATLLFMKELEQKVESIPGVRATISGGAPPNGSTIFLGPKAEGEGGAAVDFSNLILPLTSIEPDYFETMGVPIVEGRTFAPDDGSSAVILNDVMARRFWGDGTAVGRRFRMGADQPWQTVVGVAGDVKQMGPADSTSADMEFYQLMPENTRNQFYSFVIRTAGDRQTALKAVRQRVWEIDPNLPIIKASTMNERLGGSIAGPRFNLELSSAFALTGALLAAVGVYGISAYWVSRRRRELAIRMAVGATRDRLIRMVVGRSLRLAVIGGLAGFALAAAAAKTIESMLFQTSSSDPVTLVGVTIFLLALVVLGALGPAFRAASVDPMTTLRAE